VPWSTKLRLPLESIDIPKGPFGELNPERKVDTFPDWSIFDIVPFPLFDTYKSFP
jgi:hypothetical protein